MRDKLSWSLSGRKWVCSGSERRVSDRGVAGERETRKERRDERCEPQTYHAERTASGQDGGLVQGLGTLGVDGHQSVTTFVVGSELLLVVGHDHGLPLDAHHDVIPGLVHAGGRHRLHALGGRLHEKKG
jgi:hypothetical protein